MTQHISRKYFHKCKIIWKHKLFLLLKKRKSKEMLSRQSPCRNINPSFSSQAQTFCQIFQAMILNVALCWKFTGEKRGWYTYFSTNNASTSYPRKRSSLTGAEYEATWWENLVTSSYWVPSQLLQQRSWVPPSLSPSSAELTTDPFTGDHFLLLEHIETFLARGIWN